MKDKPNDIDVVSFIDYRVYGKCEEKISPLMEKWKIEGNVDGYIVARSYPGHPHFIFAQLTYEYWKDLFSQTEPNAKKEIFRKGLIKINFYE